MLRLKRNRKELLLAKTGGAIFFMILLLRIMIESVYESSFLQFTLAAFIFSSTLATLIVNLPPRTWDSEDRDDSERIKWD